MHAPACTVRLVGLRRGRGIDPKKDLIAENTKIRPAPGYPACPDHLVKRGMFDLLYRGRYRHNTHRKPGHATCCQRVRFYLSHPQSQYFSVGKIGEDQWLICKTLGHITR